MSDQGKKYKLIRAGKLPVHRIPGYYLRFYRLQALQDIPEQGVKAGDLGGYVTRKKNLSHEGSCWVADEAQIIGDVSIVGNAYIGEKAVIHTRSNFLETYRSARIHIKGNAKVTGTAFIESRNYKPGQTVNAKVIEGNAQIFGNVSIRNVIDISGDVKIYGDASLDDVTSVTGTTEIFGNAQISQRCKISGNSKILDNSRLDEDVEIIDSVIAGNTHLVQKQRVVEGKLNETKIGSSMEALETSSASINNALSATSSPMLKSPKQGNVSLRVFHDVQESIASYETDIVKLIKYPAMVDQSVPATLAMTMALKKALRFSDTPESDEFCDAVDSLEQAFVIAESNAIKMVSTILSDEDKKKTEKAKDLFRIASNEVSTEHEKKVAFVQGFKQLEGVIAVPEVAVNTFRIKIGLKELETLTTEVNNV